MKRRILFVMVAVIIICMSVTQATALIVVSGDTNIVSDNPGNIQSATNLLYNSGNGSNVIVLDGYVVSRGDMVTSFYAGLGATVNHYDSRTITLDSTLLAGVDLLVSILPERAFTSAEISAISNFLVGDTSIFFMGEYSSWTLLGDRNNNINSALAGLGSGMSLVNSTYDIGDHWASGSQIKSDPLMAGVDSFFYAAYSEVSGGKALVLGSQGALMAAEENPANKVPEPSTMLLFGAGLAGLGLMRKRMKV